MYMYYRKKTPKFIFKRRNRCVSENLTDDGEHLCLKAAAVIGYWRGLRCSDLVNITCEDCEFYENTSTWITDVGSKRRGEHIRNRFNVPLQKCDYLESFDPSLHKCNVRNRRMLKTFRDRKDASFLLYKSTKGHSHAA